MTADPAAILRHVYGPDATKKIARRFGVSVDAAKVWLAGRFPKSRTAELAATVREELDRIERRNAEIRKYLDDIGASLAEPSEIRGGRRRENPMRRGGKDDARLMSAHPARAAT